MAALVVENVHKAYGGFDVLKGINLKVDAGEFVVLVGPSGCGKSTLLNIIAGLDRETDGVINIGGQSMSGVAPRDRDIAMVFQSYALYPTMSVRQNITFGMECRNVPKVQQKAAVERVAKLLQIGNLLERKPSQLSGGQRQRVAMGRALVRDPVLFLFDEPLSNLDAKLRVEMRWEIKQLHARINSTIVYVTHDQIEAMTMATRIAVMFNGEVQQFADPETIYNRPANLFVARFMGAPPMNTFRAVLRRQETGGVIAHIGEGDEAIALPIAKNVPSHYVGSEIIVGLRPECIGEPTRTYGDAGNLGHAVKARIELVEATGAETMLLLTLGGQSALGRVDPDRHFTVGASVPLSIDLRKLCLFDPASERLIEYI
jgi:multiple sugar transport system ATP-binding protein